MSDQQPTNAAAEAVQRAQQQLADLIVQQGEIGRAVTRTMDLIEALMPAATWAEVVEVPADPGVSGEPEGGTP